MGEFVLRRCALTKCSVLIIIVCLGLGHEIHDYSMFLSDLQECVQPDKKICPGIIPGLCHAGSHNRLNLIVDLR